MTYNEFEIALEALCKQYRNGLLTREEFSAELTVLAMQFGETA